MWCRILNNRPFPPRDEELFARSLEADTHVRRTFSGSYLHLDRDLDRDCSDRRVPLGIRETFIALHFRSTRITSETEPRRFRAPCPVPTHPCAGRLGSGRDPLQSDAPRDWATIQRKEV